MLELTRIEAGAVRYTIQSVRLGDVITTCEALTAPQRAAKDLNYTRAASLEDITLLADAEKLRQIVLNLLTNAVKYTRSGEIIVDVQNADGMVLLSVRDTGRGIPGDMLEFSHEYGAWFATSAIEHSARAP